MKLPLTRKDLQILVPEDYDKLVDQASLAIDLAERLEIAVKELYPTRNKNLYTKKTWKALTGKEPTLCDCDSLTQEGKRKEERK